MRPHKNTYVMLINIFKIGMHRMAFFKLPLFQKNFPREILQLDKATIDFTTTK